MCLREVLSLKYMRWYLVFRDDGLAYFLTLHRGLLVLAVDNTPCFIQHENPGKYIAVLTLGQPGEAQDSSRPNVRRIHN